MSAGALQLVKLKGVEHGIIVFLRINVANISRYGYHELACIDTSLRFGGLYRYCGEWQANFSRVGPAVLFICSAPYDNTEEGICLR